MKVLECEAVPKSKKLLKFVLDDGTDEKRVILSGIHNRKAEENISHPKPIYREPSLLIIICANAPIAYTTENGVHVVPVGCLKD